MFQYFLYILYYHLDLSIFKHKEVIFHSNIHYLINYFNCFNILTLKIVYLLFPYLIK